MFALVLLLLVVSTRTNLPPPTLVYTLPKLTLSAPITTTTLVLRNFSYYFNLALINIPISIDWLLVLSSSLLNSSAGTRTRGRESAKRTANPWQSTSWRVHLVFMSMPHLPQIWQRPQHSRHKSNAEDRSRYHFCKYHPQHDRLCIPLMQGYSRVPFHSLFIVRRRFRLLNLDLIRTGISKQ